MNSAVPKRQGVIKNLDWFQRLALPLTGYVTLVRLLKLPGPLFPYL